MKAIKGIAVILFLTVSFYALLGWDSYKDRSANDSNENVIVLLKFKAQQNKGTVALSEFKTLLEKVKEEPHFVSIKLHIDPDDSTNILLYEEWSDVSYYNNNHMNTEHLKEFMRISNNFLTGPPEITFWKVKSVFN